MLRSNKLDVSCGEPRSRFEANAQGKASCCSCRCCCPCHASDAWSIVSDTPAPPEPVPIQQPRALERPLPPTTVHPPAPAATPQIASSYGPKGRIARGGSGLRERRLGGCRTTRP